MPNHVSHLIALKGADQKSFVASFFGENGFDFNKLIPMPDHIYKGNIGETERQKYGKNNWYDWGVENWGTKWNAYNSSITEENGLVFLKFDTAWSVLDPIIKELSKRYPSMTVEYFDEGHCFWGREVWRNGEMESLIDDESVKQELCIKLKGYDPEAED